MTEPKLTHDSGNQFSSTLLRQWRIAQVAVWLIGLFILVSLFVVPKLGLHLLWNVLIPLAPLIFVLGTGFWRNVCPLATSTLIPIHLGISKKLKPTTRQVNKLNVLGVLLLYLIVPLRHSLFNNNGFASGALIFGMVSVGFLLNMFFDWKSTWCSGLCPVLPVEKMYGNHVITSPINAHCAECAKCVKPCPDTTYNYPILTTSRINRRSITGILTIGGLPGFIYGWFQVADRDHMPGFGDVLADFSPPFFGLSLSVVLFMVLLSLLGVHRIRPLTRIFAAIAISIYYWFRLPALFGYGKFDHDGLLIDLSTFIPEWTFSAFSMALAFFFFYWLTADDQTRRSWLVRPKRALH
jgi:hypothetical protein